MQTNPSFTIRQKVTVEGVEGLEAGRVMEIGTGQRPDIDSSRQRDCWEYTIEPAGGGDWVEGIEQKQLTAEETPQLRYQRKQEEIERHATEARRLADQASACQGPEAQQHFAALSQAHSFAAVATTLGESSVGVEH